MTDRRAPLVDTGHETVISLRRTLKRLQQTGVRRSPAIADLQRIILQRIMDLDAAWNITRYSHNSK